MYFKQQEISNNINSQYGINNELQSNLTNGNAQFMIELSRQMKISYTIPSLALHISQIFFQKKCYIFYDRFIILTASFALASKLKDMDCRLKQVCHCYYNIISRMTMNFEPFNEEKMKKIKDEICIAETQILRTLEYRIDFESPHDYLKKYVDSLSQPRDVIKKVYNSSRVIILDSYRSKGCLMFNPLTICISALLIASRYEGFRPQQLLFKQSISEAIKEELKSQEKQKEKVKSAEKEDSCEQGQIGMEVEQDSSAKNNESADLMNGEQMYKCWLKGINEKEGEDLNETDILQCIKMMNSVLYLGYKNW